ncbi:MAG: FUN14 domain-containing protein [Candidatus Bathyarchaeia archaeon]
MSEIATPLVFQLGIGAIGGFVVGYAIKKVTKLIVVLIGVFLLALIYLSSQGILAVNYDKLSEAVSGWLGGAGQAVGWLTPIIAHLPFAGSFLAGFFFGFKLG